MKSFRSPIVAVLFLATLAIAGVKHGVAADAPENAVEIVRVWTSYRDAQSFVRLSEYFSGKENTGDAIVLRSQPGERDGFYFTVRLASRGKAALPDGKAVLQVIAPDAEKPRTFEFPFSTNAKRTVRLDIGLTGTDWTYEKKLPLAWKLEIFAADGSLLAQRQSFLWAKPAPDAR